MSVWYRLCVLYIHKKLGGFPIRVKIVEKCDGMRIVCENDYFVVYFIMCLVVAIILNLLV